MKVIIKATPEEAAALVKALQERREISLHEKPTQDENHRWDRVYAENQFS